MIRADEMFTRQLDNELAAGRRGLLHAPTTAIPAKNGEAVLKAIADENGQAASPPSFSPHLSAKKYTTTGCFLGKAAALGSSNAGQAQNRSP